MGSDWETSPSISMIITPKAISCLILTPSPEVLPEEVLQFPEWDGVFLRFREGLVPDLRQYQLLAHGFHYTRLTARPLIVIINNILFDLGMTGRAAMEIRTLRHFLAVAREENMTRAAERLHVSQPTLSKQIQSLEEELGRKLFVRRSFHIELTEEGRLLRRRAEDLISLADKIAGEFTALDDVTGGDVHFGLAESYQIRYLAREIKRLKGLYPGLRYHISSGDTEQVTEKLDRGLLDFAVLAEEPEAAKYNFLPFPEPDVWGLVAPAGHPLARRESIRARDIAGLPLFCSEQGWRRDIPAWCGEEMENLHLEGSFRLPYNASLFVREGLGFLLTFDRLIDTSPSSGLVFRPLEPRLETRMYLIWGRHQVLTPIAQRVLTELRLMGCAQTSNSGGLRQLS